MLVISHQRSRLYIWVKQLPFIMESVLGFRVIGTILLCSDAPDSMLEKMNVAVAVILSLVIGNSLLMLRIIYICTVWNLSMRNLFSLTKNIGRDKFYPLHSNYLGK